MNRFSGQQQPGIAPPGKTDTYAEDEKGRKFREQHGELPAANFRIAGVDLMGREDPPAQAARRLGKIESAAPGDAGDYDELVCYRSSNPGENTRLFFGRGEMDFYFTLAAGAGPLKKGEFCRRSPSITRGIATQAGIHLGMSSQDIISALGLPTRRSRSTKAATEKLFWDFEMEKKTSAKDLAQILKSHPEQSEAEIREDYGTYWQSESIRAVFTNGQLTELTVDWVAAT